MDRGFLAETLSIIAIYNKDENNHSNVENILITDLKRIFI